MSTVAHIAILRAVLCIVAGTAALSACGGEGVLSDLDSGQQHFVPTILPADLDDPSWPRDPVNLVAAEIHGDTLEIDVEYGGGCREHLFTFLLSGAFAESEPVQTWAALSHDNRGDVCRALIRERLRTDLTPVKESWQQAYQAESGTIILHIEGLPSLEYDF